MKHSKKTLALLAQFPTFTDWIVNNLTPDQLIAVRDSPSKSWLGNGHPLNDLALGGQLWRAYRAAVLFELNCWSPGTNFSRRPEPADGGVYYHEIVCMAIGLYVAEQPELLDMTVQRVRREIETATGPAQPPNSQPGAAERRNRL